MIVLIAQTLKVFAFGTKISVKQFRILKIQLLYTIIIIGFKMLEDVEILTISVTSHSHHIYRKEI